MKELTQIQNELKAPKSQFNSYGKYYYRNQEDILEAVKPLLKKNDCTLTITDEIVQVSDRVYVKATVTIESGEKTKSVSAFARESLNKKGMDESMCTGTASSYARKYALNGLFLIDDTKDADNQDNNKTPTPPAATFKPKHDPVKPEKKEPDNTHGLSEIITFINTKKITTDKVKEISFRFLASPNPITTLAEYKAYFSNLALQHKKMIYSSIVDTINAEEK